MDSRVAKNACEFFEVDEATEELRLSFCGMVNYNACSYCSRGVVHIDSRGRSAKRNNA
jgi:hypothetical protein